MAIPVREHNWKSLQKRFSGNSIPPERTCSKWIQPQEDIQATFVYYSKAFGLFLASGKTEV